MNENALNLEVLDWGRLEYGPALERQGDLVQARQAGLASDRLILVEHPPVVTLGRSSGDRDLRLSEEDLNRRGVAVFKVERGGQATFHGPGQLVAYPVLKLERKDLHWCVDQLLEAAADVLRLQGLSPEKKAGRPGLWVNSAKIASVGLAVRRWVTWHGLALNVNNDLTGFDLIVPCGRPGEKITSLSRELGRSLDLDEVKAAFIRSFRKRFGYAEPRDPAASASKHPAWLVRAAPDEAAVRQMTDRLARLRLATVCQSAHCPNLGECFKSGTATFLILGRVCTRSCRFCAVDKGRPGPVDPDEPDRVAQAALELGLRHVVVTSVTRDDLADGGAGQFVRTVARVRELCPGARIEILTPDFKGSLAALDQVVAVRPDVFNHNLETVSRLYGLIRPQAIYGRSLAVIGYAAENGLLVKSGLMLGLGETREEVRAALVDLKRAGCRHLTLGQYLAPSARHAPVARYVPPEEFDYWAEESRRLGFVAVASGPLVRSSYRAEMMYPGGKRPAAGGRGHRPASLVE
ncbi:MAG: lipoyl synthase [Thermodesulfobacteriota bacterium]